LKRFFLPVLITAAIIYLLFTQISFKDLYHLLRGLNPLWALIGFFSYLLALFFRALRYRWLIHSTTVALTDLFRVSVFYNLSLMILPSKLGELSYPYLLRRISGMPKTEGLASLIVSRVYDLLSLTILVLAVLIGSQSLFKISLFLLIPLLALLIGLTFFASLYMSPFLRLGANGLARVSKIFGLQQIKAFQWTGKKLYAMAEDFHAIQARQAYLPVILTSFASWIMTFLMFYALLRGFGTSISPAKAVFGSAVAIFSNVIPISALGNWGIMEAGWTAGFLMVGLSKAEAITTGFGVHIVTFVCGAATGFLCWITSGGLPVLPDRVDGQKQ
jgi:glycosyltransferase 2 family protein